jgi:hypothetical protein
MYDWDKIEIIDSYAKTPLYTIQKEKNLTKVSFQGKELSIPAGLASNFNNKISQIHYLFNNKTNMPICQYSLLLG